MPPEHAYIFSERLLLMPRTYQVNDYPGFYRRDVRRTLLPLCFCNISHRTLPPLCFCNILRRCQPTSKSRAPRTRCRSAAQFSRTSTSCRLPLQSRRFCHTLAMHPSSSAIL